MDRMTRALGMRYMAQQEPEKYGLVYKPAAELVLTQRHGDVWVEVATTGQWPRMER